jgi:hypothetical protein
MPGYKGREEQSKFEGYKTLDNKTSNGNLS